MSEPVDPEGWDRLLLDLSSKCTEPICKAYGLLRYRLFAPFEPGKFDLCTSKIKEIAYRVWIVIGATFAAITLVIPAAIILLAIVGKVLRGVGFALQKHNYTHVRGTAPETIVKGALKVATWNVCGVSGGMHYDHGGVVHWRQRLDGILEKIRSVDADVLVLQEIYDTALAEALIKHLSSEYTHFFTHLGANVWGSVGGCMVITKCAVHRFTNTSFSSNKWTLNRTFANPEVYANPQDKAPCARIIGTHLIHDNNEHRKQQMGEIVQSIQKSSKLPTLLMGDLNLERDDPEQGGILNPHFIHGYQGKEPTRTQKLLKQWNKDLSDPGDFIDYISIHKGCEPERLGEVKMHCAYEGLNTTTATSDHSLLSGSLKV